MLNSLFTFYSIFIFILYSYNLSHTSKIMIFIIGIIHKKTEEAIMDLARILALEKCPRLTGMTPSKTLRNTGAGI